MGNQEKQNFNADFEHQFMYCCDKTFSEEI